MPPQRRCCVGARDDVLWREFSVGMVVRPEPLALDVHEEGALSADGFAQQERWVAALGYCRRWSDCPSGTFGTLATAGVGRTVPY